MKEKKQTITTKQEIDALQKAVIHLLEWKLEYFDKDEQKTDIEVDIELNTRRLEILLWLTLLFNVGTGVLVVLYFLHIL